MGVVVGLPLTQFFSKPSSARVRAPSVEAPAGEGKRKNVVEGKDGGQKACRQDRSFPQVQRNELRWVCGAGE